MTEAPPRREWTRGLPQIAAALGTIVGSTTIVTAILFYFGWSRAYYFYDHLGIDSSLLGLTTRDYLQLSVDGLFVPVVIGACLTLAAVWAFHRLRLAPALNTPAATTVVLAAAVLLTLNGLSRIYVVTPLNRSLAVAPFCLAAGVCLLVFALRSRYAHQDPEPPEWVAVAQWAVVVVVVGLCLFWAANDYSAAVGRSRARQFVGELRTLPDAVVYSTKSLSLTGPGVHESRCGGEETRYPFRYDGLKLVLRSADGYVFLPVAWTRANGVAILLSPDDEIRLELSPPGTAEVRTGC